MAKDIRHVYKTNLQWIDGKHGVSKLDGRPDLEVDAPPEFGGPEGLWSPEHMYVAAAEVCNMTTFMSILMRRGIEIESYESEAEGILESTGEGLLFTSITIRPKVKVKNFEDAERVHKLLERAHQHCLIANSMNTEVHVVVE